MQRDAGDDEADAGDLGQPEGICVSTTTPMTVAIAGRSETMSA